MREARSPSPHLPSMQRYFETLVLFDPRITPVLYPLMIVAGAAWSAMHRPGWLLWIVAVYVGFTVFPLSIFDNPPCHLRVAEPADQLPRPARRRRGARVDGGVAFAIVARGAVVGTALLALSAVGVVAAGAASSASSRISSSSGRSSSGTCRSFRRKAR